MEIDTVHYVAPYDYCIKNSLTQEICQNFFLHHANTAKQLAIFLKKNKMNPLKVKDEIHSDDSGNSPLNISDAF